MSAEFKHGDEDFDGGLFASIAHTPVATVITDPRLPDNPIVAVNAAFLALSLYSEEEVLGRNCRLLGGAETEPEPRRILRDAVAAAEPALVELLNYRRDGSTFRNTVMIAPVFGADGALNYFIGSQMALPDREEANATLRRQRARSLVDSLTSRQRLPQQTDRAAARHQRKDGEDAPRRAARPPGRADIGRCDPHRGRGRAVAPLRARPRLSGFHITVINPYHLRRGTTAGKGVASMLAKGG